MLLAWATGQMPLFDESRAPARCRRPPPDAADPRRRRPRRRRSTASAPREAAVAAAAAERLRDDARGIRALGDEGPSRPVSGESGPSILIPAVDVDGRARRSGPPPPPPTPTDAAPESDAAATEKPPLPPPPPIDCARMPIELSPEVRTAPVLFTVAAPAVPPRRSVAPDADVDHAKADPAAAEKPPLPPPPPIDWAAMPTEFRPDRLVVADAVTLTFARAAVPIRRRPQRRR